jgi:hypothetical protein
MSPSLFADCEKVVFTLKSNGWSCEVDIAEASKFFVFLFLFDRLLRLAALTIVEVYYSATKIIRFTTIMR